MKQFFAPTASCGNICKGSKHMSKHTGNNHVFEKKQRFRKCWNRSKLKAEESYPAVVAKRLKFLKSKVSAFFPSLYIGWSWSPKLSKDTPPLHFLTLKYLKAFHVCVSFYFDIFCSKYLFCNLDQLMLMLQRLKCQPMLMRWAVNWHDPMRISHSGLNNYNFI